MPGMHGSYAANMGMTECDLLIALGVRFDDRVTGRLAAFAPHAKVIHVDIDPAEIGKNRAAGPAHRGRRQARARQAQQGPGRELEPAEAEANAAAPRAWWRQIRGWKEEHPFAAPISDTEIKPQHLMAEIDRISGGEAIVTTDVGQHQMWAAQFIRFNEPRLWLTSGGLGSMGFGLPAAIGAQFAHPGQAGLRHRAATAASRCPCRNSPPSPTTACPIKIVVMNNGYLGMVRQWQELFYNNRLCAVELECFPDAEKLAAAYGFKGRTIEKPRELAPALEAGGRRARPVPAQRQGLAVRERLPDGARRRRHQRNGAGAAAAGGGSQVDQEEIRPCCRSFRCWWRTSPAR